MALRIIWSQTAGEDLREIAYYIARDNQKAAVQPANRIFHYIESASELPYSNRMVPEKADQTIREIILKPYRIIYSIDNDRNTLHVLRIWHGCRGEPQVS